MPGVTPLSYELTALFDVTCKPMPRRRMSKPAAAIDKSIGLQSVIEAEIIPRLLLASREDVGLAQEARPLDRPGPAEIDEFVRLVLEHEVDVARACLDGLMSQGHTADTLLLDLLAPAARAIGRGWETDTLGFVEVTVALSRLQQLLRHLRPAEPALTSVANDGRRALVLPAPGEQHTFGLLIVEDFLRSGGWEVWGGQAMTRQDMKRAVQTHPFAVVGFSLSCDRLLRRLVLAIQSIRRTSMNPDIRVMVGGSVFVDQPALAARIGADALALDARHAVEVANALAAEAPRLRS